MKQKITLLLFLTLSCIMSWAGPVDLEQARGKAAKFLKELNENARLATETPEYAPARSIKGVQTANTTPAFYVFNAENECGYVIVSGDDNTDDILGYSTNGSFDVDNMPENVRAWMEGYAEQIAMLETYMPQKQTAAQYNASWTAIAPMITTQWNQSAPYNNQCPKQDGNLCVTGCSATAMAQVMKYHEWPQEATLTIPSYRTNSGNFLVTTLKPTTFNWSGMKDKYSANAEDGDAVAELMRYCGQSIKSDYTSAATSAYTSDVFTALYKYFNYDQNMELRRSAYHTPSEWESLIYNELRANRPVYHTGQSMQGGHAFVCDGYDGNGMFHFNWGWGGSYDGYFNLALMNPGTGGIGSGSADGYSFSQEIIIGIQPPTGEAESIKYFTPSAEQIINKTMFSYFHNTHPESLTANVGFATIDENDNIVKVLKDCGSLTLKGSISESKYVSLNFDSDGITLTQGTYHIATICRPKGTTQWKRVGTANKFFIVTVDGNGKVSNISQSPITDIEVTDWQCTGNLVAGMSQNVKFNIKNNGDEVFGALYLFASQTENMGSAQSRVAVLLKKGEEDEVNLAFTPETEGTYTLLVNDKDNSDSYIAKMEVTVKAAPTRPSNLSIISCIIDKNAVSAKIRIRNTSSQP
ncbi:MAG: C10 family peptidase, partial [Bacteroidaceae bacterium]|nr:C10 family peptidase [Bacteroidaceae bacterium]